MSPSDAELKDIEFRYARAIGSDRSQIIAWLARAELQRRQQPLPAGEAASVPAEMVEQWHNEWCLAVQSGGMKGVTLFAHIANKAAAYEREQCRAASVPAELVEMRAGMATAYHAKVAAEERLRRFEWVLENLLTELTNEPVRQELMSRLQELHVAAYGREQAQQIEGTHD